MTRPRHGWLLEQLPTALAEPIPAGESELTVDMRSFMRIFEEVANTVEDEIDSLDRYFDPQLAPLGFVGWMGGWLGIDISPTMPRDQQVRLLAAAGKALPWRGTARGMELLLEAFTGADVEIEDSGGVFEPGDDIPMRKAVTVRLSTGGELAKDQLFRLIRNEIPADAALTLEVAGEVASDPEVGSTDSDEGRDGGHDGERPDDDWHDDKGAGHDDGDEGVE